MLAFIFPGQGSQKRGMGEGLFGQVPEYAALESQVDALLGYSMRQLCLEDAQGRLKETQFTQPALYVVNALHYYQAVREGLTPAYVAGHSLGEYNALLAAGVFDFMTGLRLVKRRGELMSQAKNGAMSAVIGLDARAIASVFKDQGFSTIDIANFNSASQVVISGPGEDLKRVAPLLEAAGARMCMPLPVSAAFHSRYMADAAREFETFLAPLVFTAPKVPVIANVTAEPYAMSNTADSVKTMLVKQITHSVLWEQSVRYLRAHGVNEFKELGPGNVLTRLVQQIQ